jgi:hypothetical protein
MKCETLFYIGLGEESLCGKQAVALLDGEQGVCADCLPDYHPSRLTLLAPDKSGVALPKRVYLSPKMYPRRVADTRRSRR